jgi:hypothetical protein
LVLSGRCANLTQETEAGATLIRTASILDSIVAYVAAMDRLLARVIDIIAETAGGRAWALFS